MILSIQVLCHHGPLVGAILNFKALPHGLGQIGKLSLVLRVHRVPHCLSSGQWSVQFSVEHVYNEHSLGRSTIQWNHSLGNDHGQILGERKPC